MSLKSVQLTLVASTATPLLVQGAGATQFRNISGTLQDPLPISIKNEDASAEVWIGGSTVSATAGQSLAPGQSTVLNLYGNPVDVPYAFSTGTPIVSVMVGRQ